GGGILLGDGSGNNKDDLSAHIRGFQNQVVSTTNYGIAIYAGFNIQYFDNRVLSSGYLPDGQFNANQNIGIHVWNGSNSQHFENNFAYNNYIGWIRKDSEGKDIRNDSWFPDCARDQNLNSLCVDNYFYPNPITKALEQEEYKIWLDKLQENNI